jgi:hypothetical protein
MTTPQAEPSSYNQVTLPSMFGMTMALGCRRCGALVPADPPDYADVHTRWHTGLEKLITEALDNR